MENTILNKEKFFALYWGQEVLSDLTESGKRCLYVINKSNFYNIDKKEVYLQLKSLQSISDEDCVELFDLIYPKDRNGLSKEGKIDCVKHWISDLGDGSFVFYEKVTSFLRSKSYLIGYNGLTPDQIISYGWAKI